MPARPSSALHEHSIRRAVEHMHRHYAEPLRRSALARVAGFAPVYFSELFRKEHGVSCDETMGDFGGIHTVTVSRFAPRAIRPRYN